MRILGKREASRNRESLARRTVREKRTRVRLKTVSGDGVRPGVDLDDTAALLDLMES